ELLLHSEAISARQWKDGNSVQLLLALVETCHQVSYTPRGIRSASPTPPSVFFFLDE
uniref:Uncharacterized protein n=1 Tax=Aegilops tauschii subsp. strangulata TaxID=200361 RepID=A0A453AND4_AEGTS